MISSYRLSQEHNFQTVLWAIGGAVYRAGCAVGNAYHAIRAALPALLFWLGILAKALGLVAIVAGAVVAVAMIPVTFWAGLLVIGAFGWATYPRQAVRNG